MGVAVKHIEGPPVSRAADIMPKTIDAEARTVDVVASTGHLGKRTGFWEDYDEQLVMTAEAVDLNRLNTTGVVLDNHQAWGSVRDTVIGAVVPGSAQLVAGELRATMRFGTNGAADEVFRMVQEGTLRSVSVGYDPTYEEIRPKDRTDGGTRTLLRAVKWEPYEISVVPMGFDPGAVMRSAEPQQATRRYAVRSREEKQMTTQAAPETPAPAAAPQVDQVEIERRAFEAATTRALEIRSAGERFGLEPRAIDEIVRDTKLSLVEAKAKILDVRARRTDPPSDPKRFDGGGGVTLGRAAEDKQTDALALALMHRTLRGADPKRVRALNEKLKEEGRSDEITPGLGDDEMPRRFMRARLIDLAATFLESRGINTARMSPNDVAMGALHFRGAGGALATTADFSSILAAGANKMLAIGYQEVTSPWREFARRLDKPDFKQFSIFRRSGAPNLEVVNEHGEVQRASFKVGTALTGQLATAGIEVGFTRQMLINDDLDAFSQQSLGLGESAVRFEDDSIVTDILYTNPTLADGTAFFASGRGNLATDVGAPDLAALLHVMRLFELMTETIKKAGNNAGETTRKLMFKLRGFLGASTEIAAIDQILQPRFPDAATNALPRALTGASTWQDSRLAVEANPPDVWFGISTRNAFVYGGLEGDPSPRLSSMAAASTDGTIWQLIHDWYGAVEDPKAIIRVPKS